ncbi:hypothetical protein BD770DRAFT_404297, partial [Pilaira anomala]
MSSELKRMKLTHQDSSSHKCDECNRSFGIIVSFKIIREYMTLIWTLKLFKRLQLCLYFQYQALLMKVYIIIH